jgi:hypothetical protein
VWIVFGDMQGSKPEGGRDLRLDFFRGLALLIIFVDHVPGSPLGQWTPRYLGFSDAAEMFVFISGYAAGLVYGRSLRTHGVAFAALRILRRVWQIYVAHILLFTVLMVLLGASAAAFSNPFYWEEGNHKMLFLEQPDATILQVLLLRYQPSYTIILPMYVAILLMMVGFLPLFRRSARLALAVSAAAYVAARAFGIEPPSYPAETRWFFNPFAWQFLFMIGVAFGLDPSRARAWVPRGRPWLAAAVAVLAFGLFITAGWRIPALQSLVPVFVEKIVYGADKTGLAPLLLIHFLALAYVAVRLLPRYERRLAGPIARPIVRCGQSALAIFCFGVLLSFAAQVVVVEFPMGVAGRLAVDLAGIAILIGLAYGFAAWKSLQRRDERRAIPAVASVPGR